MIKKIIHVLVVCLLGFMQLQAMKVSVTRACFIKTISEQVNNYSRSTKWKAFLTLFKKYEDKNKAITTIKDLEKLRKDIVDFTAVSKKTKIYQVIKATLKFIDEYIQAECDLCCETFKKTASSSKNGNYLVVLKCKQKCCYECLFKHYIPHDPHSKKGDSHNKCPWCRCELNKDLIKLFIQDKRYKKLHEKYKKEKKEEQITTDYSEANDLYMEQLRALQNGEISFSSDEQSDEDSIEEVCFSDDGYESQEF